LLRKHLKKKSILIAGPTVISLKPMQTIQKNKTQKETIADDQQTNNVSHLNDQSRADLNSAYSTKEKRASKSELNVTLMVTLISIISMIGNTLFFVSFIIRIDITSFTLLSIALLFMAFKHASNFLVLILFNKKFRDVIFNKFKNNSEN
jgi:cation transport ATPase